MVTRPPIFVAPPSPELSIKEDGLSGDDLILLEDGFFLLLESA